MARVKKHIDHELKAKLGAHEAPLLENEWAAFESFRGNKTSKRRRLFIFTAASLVFLAISAVLLWNMQDRPGIRPSEGTDTFESRQLPGQHAPENDVRLRPEAGEKPGDMADVAVPGENSGFEESKSDVVPGPESGEFKQPTKKQTKAQNPESNLKGGQVPENTEGLEGMKPIVANPIPSILFNIPAPELKWAEIPVLVAWNKDEKGDTSKSILPKKINKFAPLSTPGLAFGMSYGFGNPNLSLGEIDSSQTHRQYENTLKEAKQNSRVFRIFLQYEYRLKTGLEFGAGLQFSSQTQVQQFNFEMRDIPYLYPNGDIWFYIPIPDSQPVTPTVFESRQNTYSASVPLSVAYAYKFGRNLRVGMRAQGSFGVNWSKAYKGLSPKTLSETTLRANTNPFNMSYGGGLFGEYFYLERWSARLSLDWTAQNKLYKESNSYNISNRYYEFKLALVRYL